MQYMRLFRLVIVECYLYYLEENALIFSTYTAKRHAIFDLRIFSMEKKYGKN